MSSDRGLTVGAFELSGRLGRGGMGEVWRARHMTTGVDAAIKVITADFARDARFQDGFHREVQAMAMLEHPSIVRVFDYGEIDRSAGSELVAGSSFVALELANSGTLSSIKADLGDWQELRAILLSLLDALAHSHARGLIHRDLKPDNVLVFDDPAGRHYSAGRHYPTGRRYKLTDFGIAHSLDADSGEGENEISGTPHYMAPEQFVGSWRSHGPSTDLYALGCVAYQLVTGRLPFDASSPMKVGFYHVKKQPDPLEPRFDVPAGFAAWVAKLMAKSPHQRYRKAADAAWALVRLGDPVRQATHHLPPDLPDDPESMGTAPTLASAPIDFAFGPTLGVTAGQLDSDVLGQFAGEEPAGEEPAGEEPASMDASERGPSRQAPPDAPLPTDTAPTGTAPTGTAPIPKHWESHVEPVQTTQSLATMSPRLYGLRAIPLVGRREQRDALWDVLRQTHRHQTPRLVVVEGPSGCGKSRLARWLSERADELGVAEVMQAVHAAEGARGEGLQGMLRRWFRSSGLTDHRLASRISERLGMADGERSWLTDELCRFLSEDTELGDVDRRDSFPALAALFEQVAQERALIVWLDDLQWGEEAVQFLEFVLSAKSYSMPVVFLATVQGEAIAERPLLAERIDALVHGEPDQGEPAQGEPAQGEQVQGKQAGLRLQVDALSQTEARELIGELLDLDDTLVARIERRVDGNPLFAVQLVGDWVERGWLVGDAHGFRLADGVTPQLPDDLHEVWAGRITRLLEGRPDDDTVALELAAALGREVDFVEWEVTCQQAGIEASRSLVHLMVDQRLARVDDSGWAFIHGMLCESLVRIMRYAGEWRPRNAVAAAALERLRANTSAEGRAAELGGRIGRHHFYAGAYESALAPLLEGAASLHDRDGTVAALEMLDMRDRAIDQLIESGASAQIDGRSRLEGLVLRASIYNALKRFDEAAAVAEKIHDEAAEAGWTDFVAHALLTKCRTEHLIGRSEDAAHLAQDALTIFEELGDSEGILRARLRLGDHDSYIGDSEQAIEHYQVALERAEAVGDLRSAAWSQWGIGYALQQLMRFDDAREPLERGYQLNLDAGRVLGASAVLSSLADNDRWTGDFDTAETRYLEVWRAHTDRGLPSAAVALNIATLYAQSGRFDEARQWVARAQAETKQGHTRMWTSLYCLRLTLAAQAEDWTGFDDYLSKLRAGFAESSHVDLDRASLIEEAGLQAHRSGEDERARQVYTLALRIRKQLELDEHVERIEQALDELR